MAPDCIGQVVEDMARKIRRGTVLLLENLRFHPEEEANDPEISAKRFTMPIMRTNPNAVFATSVLFLLIVRQSFSQPLQLLWVSRASNDHAPAPTTRTYQRSQDYVQCTRLLITASRISNFTTNQDSETSVRIPFVVVSLLKIKPEGWYLAAGSNRRPWSYEYYFNTCMQFPPKNKQPLSAGNSRLSRT
jgi:hypothetical protein